MSPRAWELKNIHTHGRVQSTDVSIAGRNKLKARENVKQACGVGRKQIQNKIGSHV
jgi:hypothetical protein